MMSFPQVLIDGEVLGGFQETLAADRAGRLAQLIEPAA
jgi:glutaredoxin 3